MNTDDSFYDYGMSVDLLQESDASYCCEIKAKLMPNNNFIETLIIKPRYVIFNKSPKGVCHKETIEIKNQFDLSRTFEVKNNLPNIIRAKKLPHKLLLHPNIPHKIELLYGPTQRHPISDNQRFSIYLSSDHPNCIIEIPVFVILGPPSHDISIPKWIKMPSTAPNLSSFYNLLIYNPFKDNLAFTIKKLEKPNQTLNISKQCATLKKGCGVVITLEAISDNNCPFESDLILHFTEMKIKIKVLVETSIKNYNLHLNQNVVQFDNVYFGHRSESYLRVCNESQEIVKYKWCRREKKPFEFFQCLNTTDDELFVKTIDKVFQIIPKFGRIAPCSSKTFLLVFLPTSDIKQIESKAYFSFSSDHSKRTEVIFKGTAIGAQIDFITKELILNNTYVGALRTIEALVENTGPIEGKISYESFDSVITAYCKVEPLEIILKPKEKDVFIIKYFTATIGEFLDKITFQVEHSDRRTLFMKGNSIPVQLKVYPNLIEFGRIPVCSVQKKNILIANPLSVPIVINCSIGCDGVQIPLILDIPNEETKPNEIINFSEGTQAVENLSSEDFENIFSYWIREAKKNELSKTSLIAHKADPSVESLYSFVIEPCLTYETVSSCSDFNNSILELEEDLPDLARILIKNVKNPKVVNYREADLNALQQIFNILKNKSEFQQLTELDNIVDRNWELNDNPREFIISHQSIYLQPLESVEILVGLTPNLIGNFEKILDIRVTPINRLAEEDLIDENEFTANIDPKYLTTKVPIYYKSMVPKLEMKSEIEFSSYVEKKEFFQMIVKNITNIGGFAEFIISSKSLKIYFAPRKFYIASNQNKIIKILFIPLITGKINVTGKLSILGSDSIIPFSIKCKAASPKLLIKPVKLVSSQKVTILKQHTIFIENISPTKARFVVNLKIEMDCLEINPLGGILGPGQCAAIVINAYFTDPGTYLNTVQIHLKHFGVIEVPININVEGIPVKISVTSIDFGCAFVSDKIYEKELEFINNGRKEYKINFLKIKNDSNLTYPEFFVSPRTVILQPNGHKTKVIFSIQSSVAAKVLEYYVIIGVYDTRKKFRLDAVPVSINFYKPKLTWDKNKVSFLSQNTTFPPNETINQIVLLTNCAPIRALVNFNVVGNFKVVVDTESLRKEIVNGDFYIDPSEEKEIGILVNNNIIESNRRETYLTGKIFVKCEGVKQNTLELEAVLTYPTIEICNPEQYYLSAGNKFYAKFYIKNKGTLQAYYKWKTLQECVVFQNDSDLNIQHLNNQILNFSEIIQSKPCTFYLTHLFDIDEEYENYLEIISNKDEDSDLLVIDPDQNPVVESSLVRSISNVKKLSKSQSKIQKGLITRMSKILPIETKSALEIKEEGSSHLPNSEFEYVNEEIYNFIKYKNSKENEVIQEIYNKIDNYEFVYDDDDEDLIKNNTTENCNCTKLNAILLDNYDDKLEPDENRIVGVFFDRDGFDNRITKRTYYYTYELQIGGGESQSLSLSVFDFNSKIVIPMSLYDFGKQPWYKKLNIRINLFNPNLFNCKVRTIDSQLSSFVYGYVKSKCRKCFILGENVCCATFIQAFFGFSSYFNETFGIEVNKLVPIPISFQGCGLIPQLKLLNVNRPTFHTINPNITYPTLEYMYQNEILNKSVTPTKIKKSEIKILTKYLNQFNYEEENPVNLKASKLSKKGKEDKLTKDKKIENDLSSRKGKNPAGVICKSPKTKEIEELVVEEAAPIEELEQEEETCPEEETEELDILNICPLTGKYYYALKHKNIFRASVIEKVDNDICDFEVLDYPNEYPTPVDIETQIEKTIFLRNLEKYEENAQIFSKIIQKCVIPKPDSKEIYYKTFIIRPLPHHTIEYFVDFNQIMLNEFNYYELDLVYYGPGNLIMAARTDIIIPGFKTKLSCNKIITDSELALSNELDPNFTPYNTEHNTTDKYENLSERNRGSEYDMGNCDKCKNCVGYCAECRIKLCHPHSYDVDLNYQHQRVYDKYMRKTINDYYSKLNQGYKETKPNYVLSEIYQRQSIDIDAIKLKLKIQYYPSHSQYAVNQEFEDYLYIDVHLGTTIPILMKGVFKKPVKSACTLEINSNDVECEAVKIPPDDTRTL